MFTAKTFAYAQPLDNNASAVYDLNLDTIEDKPLDGSLPEV
ncbi:hypothetical protein [Staphylococcus chromogenes]|nr:hypothetical protein [Staphylococcus chromogenes]